MESKFKISDKVIGNEKADYYIITKAGYTGEVTKIFHNGLFQISGQFMVREECFDRIPSRQEIHITCIDGKTTHAVKKIDGKIVGRAKATCAPDDAFKFDEGAELAFERLTREADYNPDKVELSKPKYYNGKVVCTKDGLYHTAGRVYEIKDGVINDNSGVFNYNKDAPVKSIGELNFMVFPKFIKFKGEQK